MSRIVLIEDDEGIAEMIGFTLEMAGHQVMAAQDGISGLRLARTGAPDVVLLDLMLPGMDGIQVCRRLRRSSRTPVIMLTAHEGSRLDAVKNSELGVDDYIGKPFSTGDLLARIGSVLRRADLAYSEPGRTA